MLVPPCARSVQMGAVWGIREEQALPILRSLGMGEATGVGGGPIQPRDLPRKGHWRVRREGVPDLGNPMVRKGIQGSGQVH